MGDPTATTVDPADVLDLSVIIKAYDVRGTTPDQIDAASCKAIGAAFAAFAGAAKVVVARDMRPSGVELVAAFVAGVRAQGVDVIDLGLASTDLLYYAAGVLDAPGAIFTASHNPAQYNGIKMCLSGARPIGADTGLIDIRVAAQAGGPPPKPEAEWGTVSERALLGDFAVHVRQFFGSGPKRPLKLVCDYANGMGGFVAPTVFEALPFEVTPLYEELDGTFPNHPADPIQEANQADCKAKIAEVGADVGLCFDGDADRVFLVDELGVSVPGSTLTAMVAAALLDRNGNTGTVLHNLICSKAVAEVVREHGGTPVRTKVGHSYIKAIMAETGAIFGGEHSGHYYFADNFRADSGIIASMVILGILCADGRPLSQVRKPFERYAASGEINTEVADPRATVAAVKTHFESVDGVTIDEFDGLTVDAGSWWVNLRASNTEPLLRLNLEAADPAACEAHTADLLGLINSATSAT